jgi:hypothetical protein
MARGCQETGGNLVSVGKSNWFLLIASYYTHFQPPKYPPMVWSGFCVWPICRYFPRWFVICPGIHILSAPPPFTIVPDLIPFQRYLDIYDPSPLTAVYMYAYFVGSPSHFPSRYPDLRAGHRVPGRYFPNTQTGMPPNNAQDIEQYWSLVLDKRLVRWLDIHLHVET